MKKYLPLIGIIVLAAYMSCGGEENHPPVIDDITFNPTDVYPGQDVTCTVVADDEDEDPLTYNWIVDEGTLSATAGESVVWTVPDNSDTYTITVEATDEGGLTDEFSKNLTVLPNYMYGENTNSVPIHDTTWAISVINISGAPATAEVESLTVTLDITHTYPADLQIFLTAPDNTSTELWHFNYPGGTQTITTTIFAGRVVNGDWTLSVWDAYLQDEGLLNNWNITLWFEL